MKRLAFLLLLICSHLSAQDPGRYRDEIAGLKAADPEKTVKNLNLFTGSSSIRMWPDLQASFPESNVLNRGFGGSLMHELYYYTYDLIIDYKPKRIFIYEGDNDLAGGKATVDILKDADKIVRTVRAELGKRVKIYFITPKPSIRRWDQKAKFETYIGELKRWAEGRRNVEVIDVWTPMLDDQGQLRTDLFLEDGLHMNEKGYTIWTSLLQPHVRKR